MKSYIDGNAVCLTNDDFLDLQNSEAIFCQSPRQLAVALVLSNILEDPHSYKTQFWLYPEDFDENSIGFKEGGRLPKVTIEWVDEFGVE